MQSIKKQILLFICIISIVHNVSADDENKQPEDNFEKIYKLMDSMFGV